MRNFLNNLKMFLWLSFITGIVYPLLITGLAQLILKPQAEGNFILKKNKVIGSSLIGQKFESNHYFWGRPSAVDYNPLPSGGSNFGPTSMALKTAVEERKQKIEKWSKKMSIPSELLFASGSGLDPHITPKTALFQVDRIVQARAVHSQNAKEVITNLISKFTEPRTFGFLGEPRVNVLKLNLALDELHPMTN